MHLYNNGLVIRDKIVARLKTEGLSGNKISRKPLDWLAQSVLFTDNTMYALCENIAHGGFGRIKLCQDLNCGKLYVCKIIPTVQFNPIEKELNKKMGILIDFTQTSQKTYLILRQFTFDLAHVFDNLQTILKINNDKKSFYLNSAIKMISKVQMCHNLGVIHRDISPDNFMFDEKSNDIVLIDYGLSINENTWFYRRAHVCGKKSYFAPELNTYCLLLPYSFKSDIYALGITLQNVLFMLKFEDLSFFNKVVNIIKLMTIDDPAQRISLQIAKNRFSDIQKTYQNSQSSKQILLTYKNRRIKVINHKYVKQPFDNTLKTGNNIPKLKFN